VIANDAEGVSDVYIRAFFDSREESKETDTHFRCGDGKASFNYRMLFNVKHPRKDYSLTVQLWDRDLLSSNEVIGETTFNLEEAFNDASLTKKPTYFSKKYYNSYYKDTKAMKGKSLSWKDDSSFWLPCMGKDPKDKSGKIKEVGKVRVQIDILPIDQ
jgi:C2 domain